VFGTHASVAGSGTPMLALIFEILWRVDSPTCWDLQAYDYDQLTITVCRDETSLQCRPVGSDVVKIRQMWSHVVVSHTDSKLFNNYDIICVTKTW